MARSYKTTSPQKKANKAYIKKKMHEITDAFITTVHQPTATLSTTFLWKTIVQLVKKSFSMTRWHFYLISKHLWHGRLLLLSASICSRAGIIVYAHLSSIEPVNVI